jgi:hypothetical protein
MPLPFPYGSDPLKNFFQNCNLWKNYSCFCYVGNFSTQMQEEFNYMKLKRYIFLPKKDVFLRGRLKNQISNSKNFSTNNSQSGALGELETLSFSLDGE